VQSFIYLFLFIKLNSISSGSNKKVTINTFSKTISSQNGQELEENSQALDDWQTAKENEQLRGKLKSAAKYISHLLQEKEHLIEMSNQLRGELNRIKCKKLF
jgi:hypothetical protein